MVDTVRSVLLNLRRSINEPIDYRHYISAAPQLKLVKGRSRLCCGSIAKARRKQPRFAPASSASRDLRLPNVDAVLEGQITAAGGRFRGIRHIAAHDPAIIGASSYVPPPGLMDDPNFRRGLKRLPAHNLTFEAWIYHPQIKTLTEVARECSDVRIVLNHFGGPLGVGPYKRDEVFP